MKIRNEQGIEIVIPKNQEAKVRSLLKKGESIDHIVNPIMKYGGKLPKAEYGLDNQYYDPNLDPMYGQVQPNTQINLGQNPGGMNWNQNPNNSINNQAQNNPLIDPNQSQNIYGFDDKYLDPNLSLQGKSSLQGNQGNTFTPGNIFGQSTNKYFNRAATFGNAALASINGFKGILDNFGNSQRNLRTTKQESLLNARGLRYNNINNMPQNQRYDQNNPLTMEFGGNISVNNYKAENGISVEAENKEMVVDPTGLAGELHGATHNQGGIDLTLPSGSLIFSQKLKDPDTKKSYAKLAKPFSTEKDINNLDSKFTSKVGKATSELNIKLKNQKLQELFQKQEMDKAIGVHGTKVQKQTMDEMETQHNPMEELQERGMAYGGIIPKAGNGILTQQGYNAIDKFENSKGSAQGTSMNKGTGYSKTKEKDIQNFIGSTIGLDTWNKLPDNLKTQAYSFMFNHGTDDSVWKGLAQAINFNKHATSGIDMDSSRQNINTKDAISTIKNAKIDNNTYNNYINQVLPAQYQSIADNYSGGFDQGQQIYKNTWQNRASDINQIYNSQQNPSGLKPDLGYDGTGTWHGDNQDLKKKGSQWNAMTHYNSLDEYAKAVGYTGTIDTKNPQKTSLAIQKFVGQKYPELVKKYHEQYGQPYHGNPYDSKLGVRWEAIADEINQKQPIVNPPAQGNPPVNPPATQGSDAMSPIDKFNRPNTLQPNNYNVSLGNFNIPSNLSKDPIGLGQLNPTYIDPRYLDIQPQLNDIQRGKSMFQRNLGSRTSTDVANLLQSQANGYDQAQQLYGQKYNYDNQQDSRAQEFNAQVRNNIGERNLNRVDAFNDLRYRRDAAYTLQLQNKEQQDIQNNMLQNNYDTRNNFIAEHFGYPDANQEYILQPTKKKALGGKIKLPKKKLK